MEYNILGIGDTEKVNEGSIVCDGTISAAKEGWVCSRTQCDIYMGTIHSVCN